MITTDWSNLMATDGMDELFIRISGNVYRVGDGDWLSVSAYSKKHGVSISQVLTLIKRGHIREDEILVIPELNDLRLVRDRDYSDRTRKYSPRVKAQTEI